MDGSKSGTIGIDGKDCTVPRTAALRGCAIQCVAGQNQSRNGICSIAIGREASKTVECDKAAPVDIDSDYSAYAALAARNCRPVQRVAGGNQPALWNRPIAIDV